MYEESREWGRIADKLAGIDGKEATLVNIGIFLFKSMEERCCNKIVLNSPTLPFYAFGVAITKSCNRLDVNSRKYLGVQIQREYGGDTEEGFMNSPR